MTVRKPLTDRDLVTLRQRGLILAEETAFWQDGVLTVENVLSKQQRLLTTDISPLLESSRKVLKG